METSSKLGPFRFGSSKGGSVWKPTRVRTLLKSQSHRDRVVLPPPRRGQGGEETLSQIRKRLSHIPGVPGREDDVPGSAPRPYYSRARERIAQIKHTRPVSASPLLVGLVWFGWYRTLARHERPCGESVEGRLNRGDACPAARFQVSNLRSAIGNVRP